MHPPPPPTSPLITESSSSPSTRAESPPRIYTMRPTSIMHQPGHIVDVVTSQQLESISQSSSLHTFISEGKPEEDVRSILNPLWRFIIYFIICR